MLLPTEANEEEEELDASFEEFSAPLVVVPVTNVVDDDVTVLLACRLEFGSCGVGEGVLSLFRDSCFCSFSNGVLAVAVTVAVELVMLLFVRRSSGKDEDLKGSG